MVSSLRARVEGEVARLVILEAQGAGHPAHREALESALTGSVDDAALLRDLAARLLHDWVFTCRSGVDWARTCEWLVDVAGDQWQQLPYDLLRSYVYVRADTLGEYLDPRVRVIATWVHGLAV